MKPRFQVGFLFFFFFFGLFCSYKQPNKLRLQRLNQRLQLSPIDSTAMITADIQQLAVAKSFIDPSDSGAVLGAKYFFLLYIGFSTVVGLKELIVRLFNYLKHKNAEVEI